MACPCQGVVERVALEVDGDEVHILRERRQTRGALALVALRCGMVHLEDDDVPELLHPPGSSVETRAENDELG